MKSIVSDLLIVECRGTHFHSYSFSASITIYIALQGFVRFFSNAFLWEVMPLFSQHPHHPFIKIPWLYVDCTCY